MMPQLSKGNFFSSSRSSFSTEAKGNLTCQPPFSFQEIDASEESTVSSGCTAKIGPSLPKRIKLHIVDNHFPGAESRETSMERDSRGNMPQQSLASTLKKINHATGPTTILRFPSSAESPYYYDDYLFTPPPAVSSNNTVYSNGLACKSLPAPESVSLAKRKAYQLLQSQCITHQFGDEDLDYDRDIPANSGQVILFKTSLTPDTGVRNRIRMLETLLEIKLIPHHTIDIADNVSLRKRLEQNCIEATGVKAMPVLPVLFVDNNYIGDGESIQEMVDAGIFEEHLRMSGFIDPFEHEPYHDSSVRVHKTFKVDPHVDPKKSSTAVKSTQELSKSFLSFPPSTQPPASPLRPFSQTSPPVSLVSYDSFSTYNIDHQQMPEAVKPSTTSSDKNFPDRNFDRQPVLTKCRSMPQLQNVSIDGSFRKDQNLDHLASTSSGNLKSQKAVIVLESILKSTSSFRCSKVKSQWPHSFRKPSSFSLRGGESHELLAGDSEPNSDNHAKEGMEEDSLKLPHLVSNGCSVSSHSKEVIRERGVTFLEPIVPVRTSERENSPQNKCFLQKMVDKLNKLF